MLGVKLDESTLLNVDDPLIVGIVRARFLTVHVPDLLLVVPPVHFVLAGYLSAQVIVNVPELVEVVVPDCVIYAAPMLLTVAENVVDGDHVNVPDVMVGIVMTLAAIVHVALYGVVLLSSHAYPVFGVKVIVYVPAAVADCVPLFVIALGSYPLIVGFFAELSNVNDPDTVGR